MNEVEVHFDVGATTLRVGLLRHHEGRRPGSLTRILATNIDLDEGTCSVELLESACGYYGLSLARARAVIREVAEVTRSWREIAREVGARKSEIERMASAFEHEELRAGLS